MVLRGVHFDFNKADIRAQDAAVLDEAAETLKAHPDVAVAANGYCDSIGGVTYNLRLSERRADAVVRYLADHGIADSRLSPHGFGKTDFVASTPRRKDAPRTAGSNWCRTRVGVGRVFIMGTHSKPWAKVRPVIALEGRATEKTEAAPIRIGAAEGVK